MTFPRLAAAPGRAKHRSLFGLGVRGRRALALAPLFFFFAGCAAVTPPPRFSPQSPADPGAPEAATPPPVPALMGGAEVSIPSEQSSEPPQGHEGHANTGPGSGSTAAEYTCTMHPDIKRDSPGNCPICGMTLVKKEPKRREN